MRTWLWILLILPHLATTFVVLENGVEVGRWDEDDGSDATEIIENTIEPQNGAAGSEPAAAAGPKIHPWFYGSRGYDAVTAHLKKTGEPVFLYFYASWCPVCHRFDNEILVADAVRSHLASFKKVKIDAEKDVKLAKMYRVTGYPTFFVVTRQGAKQVGRYSEPETFLKYMQQAGLR